MYKLFKSWLLLAALICMFASSPTAYAKIITVTGTGQYAMTAGLNESPSLAKERAKENALRKVAEEAGFYLESVSEAKSGTLTKDEIQALSAAIVKLQGNPKYRTEILEEDAFLFYCDITAQVDTDSITPQMLADLKKDIQRNKQILDLEKKLQQLNSEQEETKAKYATALDQYEKAELARKIKKNNDRFQAIQWLKTGIKLYDKNLLVDAFKAYNNAIELYPDYADAYTNRGNIYAAYKAYDKAIADYDKAISLDPKDKAAYHNKGTICYFLVKDYPSAIACYDKIISIDQQDARALYLRGASYYAVHEYAKALEDMNKVLAIYPQSKDALEKRRAIYDAMQIQH